MPDANEPVRLYVYATSPYANKVSCYLHFKGIPFETIHVDPLKRREIRFTRQPLIPVLQLDEQWRTESSEIGLWLEERFPEKPMLPADAQRRERVLEIDDWISHSVIPMFFRNLVEVDWLHLPTWLANRYRYALGLHRARKLPLPLLALYPLAAKMTPFVRAHASRTPQDRSLKQLKGEVFEQVERMLDGGPFFAGEPEPTMADLSFYPLMAMPHCLNLKGDRLYERPAFIREWVERMAPRLPVNPLLVPEHAMVNRVL